jgi:hypothetical protein
MLVLCLTAVVRLYSTSHTLDAYFSPPSLGAALLEASQLMVPLINAI